MNKHELTLIGWVLRAAHEGNTWTETNYYWDGGRQAKRVISLLGDMAQNFHFCEIYGYLAIRPVKQAGFEVASSSGPLHYIKRSQKIKLNLK